jgi:hypothetical protein
LPYYPSVPLLQLRMGDSTTQRLRMGDSTTQRLPSRGRVCWNYCDDFRSCTRYRRCSWRSGPPPGLSRRTSPSRSLFYAPQCKPATFPTTSCLTQCRWLMLVEPEHGIKGMMTCCKCRRRPTLPARRSHSKPQNQMPNGAQGSWSRALDALVLSNAQHSGFKWAVWATQE